MFRNKIIKVSIIVSIALAMPFFASAEEVRDIVFPVDGENNFQDTFGDARSGGRTHSGTDIIAAKMTPLVSAVDGDVDYITETEPSWGYALYIKDDDGYSYRYLHINNDTPGTDDGRGGYGNAFAPGIARGSRVVAGQLVGWAGDSGNAEDVGSHLHFEIWKPDEVAINSYPSLLAASRVKGVSASFQFSRDLELGDTGLEVKELQKYLNSAGYMVAPYGPGSSGNETELFGFGTQAALIKFQQANNIRPAAGYFGPLTRDLVNGTAVIEKDTVSGIQPGWLVKNLKYAEVFYVNSNLELCWVVSEEAAEKHFGPTWNYDIKEYEDLGSMGMKFGDNIK